MTVPADWSQLSHRQLYEAVHSGPGRAISVAAEERWARIEATVLGIEQRISAALARSNGGWEGAAADTTRAAVSPLGAWALDAAGDARLTAGAVVSQAEHAAELRRLFPPPTPDPAPGPIAGRIGRIPASPDVVAQQAAADADAKRLMSSYANHSYENDRYLDYWTVPPSVTVDSTPIGPAGAGQVVGGGDGFAGAGGPGPAGTGTGGAGVGGGAGSSGAAPGGAASGGVGPAAVGSGGVGSGAVGPGGVGPGGVGPGVIGAGVTGAGQAGSGGVGPGVIAVTGAGRAGSGGVGPGQAGGGAVESSVPAGQVTGGAPPGSLPPGGPAGRSGTSGGPRVPGPLGATGSPREPTAGGRGPSRVTTPFGVGPVTPIAPAVPRSAPAPGWRDVVPHAEPQPRSDPGRTARPEPPGRITPVPEEAARPAGSRGAGLSGMYPPPMMGAGGGSQGGEHRRPGWLVDDTGAFDDHRWFPPAVLTPEDSS